MSWEFDKKMLGSKIQECRVRKGITQEQLAIAVDVSVSHITAIENGYRLPGIELFIRIVNEFKSSPNALMAENYELDFTLGGRKERLKALIDAQDEDGVAYFESAARVMKYGSELGQRDITHPTKK